MNALHDAMKETAERYAKRPTKRLKDVNNVVSLNSVGSSPFKKNK